MTHAIKRFVRRTQVLLLLALLLCGGSARAQLSIGFGGPGFVGMPDTIPVGDTTLVGVFLKNYANIAFLDSVEITGTIDTGSGPNAFSFVVAPNVYLAAQDSLFALFPIHFDVGPNGNFRIGNNVIIVWPRAIGSPFLTEDTLSAVVFIPPTGIRENEEHGKISMFPNPGDWWFELEVKSNSPRPVYVAVYDVSGRILFEADDPGLRVDASEWPSGMYFVDYIFEDRSRHVTRVIKR
jgi:hypothetical protein